MIMHNWTVKYHNYIMFLHDYLLACEISMVRTLVLIKAISLLPNCIV